MRFHVPTWLKNLAQPRGGSRAHLAPVGAVVVAVLVVAVALVQPHHAATPAARVVAAVPALPASPPPAGQPVITGLPGAPAAAPAPAASTAAAASLPPPAGLVAGHTAQTVELMDQFNQYTQSSHAVLPSPQSAWTSLAPAPGTPAWRQTLDVWFQLSAPARIATLQRGGGSDASSVSATVDGASMGGAMGYGTQTETATIVVAPGWHHLIVTATGRPAQGSAYRPAATAVQFEVGDGVTPPSTVTPYAVTASSPPVSAPASSAGVPAPHAPTPGVAMSTGGRP